MYLKFAYFINLFLIVTFSAVLLAAIGMAPDRPFLFLAVSAACVLLIRFLWKSVRKEEALLRRRRRSQSTEKGISSPPEWKRPAGRAA
jgi:heme exporter protein D